MNFEIALMPAMIIMGAKLSTTFENSYHETPAFWKQQYESDAFSKIPNKAFSDVVVGVYTNYSPDFSPTNGHYSFIAGCPVKSVDVIPVGMVIKQIPAGKYAVFTAKGPFASAVGKAWGEIWQNKDIKRKFTTDFEWYDSASTNDANSIVKIYIAIE